MIQSKLPDKSVILEQYHACRSGFETILSTMEYKLRDTIFLSSKPTFKSRVKSFDSYYRKVLRVKPEVNGDFPLPLLTDMMGIRIICAFLEDLTVVEQQIKDNFVVKETCHKGDGFLKNKVEQLRKEHGLNQEDFAKLLRVSRQTISSIETGKYNPSLELAFAISDFFNKSIEEIFIYERGTENEKK